MEKIRGTIDTVIYFDKEKCFGIVKINVDYRDPEMSKYRNILFSKIVTVLSTFDRRPLIDEEYEFEGEIETSNYGLQFKAKTFNRVEAKTVEGVVAYLSSDLFPHVGMATAKRVCDALGDKCIEIILNNPHSLDDVVKNKVVRDSIINGINQDSKNRKSLIELLNMGFTVPTSVKLLNKFGEDAYLKIKNNPYTLMYEMEGFGFIKSDEVAKRIGIKESDPVRIKALIHYTLLRKLQDTGNTYIPLNDLISFVIAVTNKLENVCSNDQVKDFIKELKIEKRIIVDENDLVYSLDTFYDEREIANLVFSHLQNTELEYSVDKIDSTIKTVMKENGIDYTDKQVEGIKKALLEPIIIITGGPGTGKSTIIKGIVDTYSRMFKNYEEASDEIYLCAPTGRAAKRLKEVTLHNATTIHKLLQFTGENRFLINKDNPLEGKMLIIDEFSMVDTNLARRLFEALPRNMKIVIVGDADQLPSVNPGNVLLDLIKTKEITTIYLDQIHRQKNGSSIISLAHEVRGGAIPYDIYDKLEDRRFVNKKDDEIIPYVINTVSEAIKSGMDLVKDIQVLVPQYKGDLGIEAINFALQDKFNPKGEQVIFNGKVFRTRDKVIQLVNRSEKNVMNGDIGYIEEVTYVGDKFIKLTCVFDVGRVDYSLEELSDLMLAYAISIHKSQGSEFSLIIMPLSMKYYRMLKRKLIYTAITRAKKYLIMCGNLEAIRKGVVEIEEERQTMLCKRIKDIYDNGIVATDNDVEELEEVTPFDFM